MRACSGSLSWEHSPTSSQGAFPAIVHLLGHASMGGEGSHLLEQCPSPSFELATSNLCQKTFFDVTLQQLVERGKLGHKMVILTAT